MVVHWLKGTSSIRAIAPPQLSLVGAWPKAMAVVQHKIAKALLLKADTNLAEMVVFITPVDRVKCDGSCKNRLMYFCLPLKEPRRVKRLTGEAT